MAKPFRSPLVGYNHNISHLGHVFHVQTEDSGPTTPRLFTHLFFQGTILASQKCEYEAALADDRVRALMQSQHKTVIKDVLQSRLDERIVAFFSSRGEDLMPLVNARAAAAATAAQMRDLIPGPAPPQAPVRENPAPAGGPSDVATGGVAPGGGGVVPAAAPPRAINPALGGRREPARAATTPAMAPATPPRRRTAGYQLAKSAPTMDSSSAAGARGGGGPGVGVRGASSPGGEGVVVQRNVVVVGAGASTTAPARPARIRPPIPYVVTGGGHTERLPPPAPSPLAPSAAPAATGQSSPASLSRQAAPVSVASVESARVTGAFGVPLGDDKSLDEVILEYLSDDSDTGQP